MLWLCLPAPTAKKCVLVGFDLMDDNSVFAIFLFRFTTMWVVSTCAIPLTSSSCFLLRVLWIGIGSKFSAAII